MTAAGRGHRVTLFERPGRHRRAGRGGGPRARPGRVRSTSSATWRPRRGGRGATCRPAYEVDGRVPARRGAGRGGAGHRGPAAGRPWWARRASRGWWTCARCSTGRPGRPGAWSWWTSWASTRRLGGRAAGRPGLRGRGDHHRDGRGPGSRHHPGPGDLEREGARQGHPAAHRRGGAGRPGEDGRAGWCVRCSTTRPGPRCELALRLGGVRGPAQARRTSCGSSCAVPPGGVPFEVHRVGDCLAPRRAHAAVIEGERVAVAERL